MPARFAPYLFGFVLSGLMSAVVSGIATVRNAGLVDGLFGLWMNAYALFQAANNTAVMNGAIPERRGVTSALLGLSRNLGLITGASAMGAVFAFGSRGEGLFGLGTGGEAGLQLTFAVATVLGFVALAVAMLARRKS